MKWVIDCSLAAALFLPDEKSESASSFAGCLKKNDELHIPLLWWYEMTNVLSVSVKRNRLKQTDSIEILQLFDQLDLITDKKSGSKYSKELFDITQKYPISSYDAAYLGLAMRVQSGIASLDRQLCKTAGDMGVKVYKV